jgi:acyl dehydratase
MSSADATDGRTAPAAAPDLLCFEDLQLGQVRELGSFSLTAAEIVEFAARFDPHPFHVDEEAARETFFGGLVASGVHTFASFSRLMYDGCVGHVAMVAGRGIREMQLRSPLRPGERVDCRATVVDARDAPNRPTAGMVTFQGEGTKDDGSQVITLIIEILVRRRTPADASTAG